MWRSPKRCQIFPLSFLLTHPVWDVTSKYSEYGGYSYRFLLTHPVWDVTNFCVFEVIQWTDFYSHIPCEMWPVAQMEYWYHHHFYSHIPCEMWQIIKCSSIHHNVFLLTHPVWDVTIFSTGFTKAYPHFYSHIPCEMWRYKTCYLWPDSNISTHTSRVRCDKGKEFTEKLMLYFYSHIPCEMWHNAYDLAGQVEEKFLLTHPVWDVTRH